MGDHRSPTSNKDLQFRPRLRATVRTCLGTFEYRRVDVDDSMNWSNMHALAKKVLEESLLTSNTS